MIYIFGIAFYLLLGIGILHKRDRSINLNIFYSISAVATVALWPLVLFRKKK
jgi:hypothetical protein